MSNFNDIQQMFIEEYGTDISEITKCFSFVGDFIYYTDKTTFSTISTKFASPIVDEISRIMGHDRGTFQINTAIKGLTVNSENWYDMIIRPSYERDDAYIIRVVIRNPDREVMNKLITEFESKILDVINFIEA